MHSTLKPASDTPRAPRSPFFPIVGTNARFEVYLLHDPSSPGAQAGHEAPPSGDADAQLDASDGRDSPWLLVGLVLIAASTLAVEVTLTKFFGYKVHHHYTYVIISTVIFSLGAAGVYVHLRSRSMGGGGESSWGWLSKMAAWYSITLLLAIVFFSWCPIDPAAGLIKPWLRKFSLSIYFVLFAIPMFFAGICVSYTLTVSKRPVMTIYFWDLLGAAAGAGLCPLLLLHAGGYGAIAIASVMGMAAAWIYARMAPREARGIGPVTWTLFGVTLLGFSLYPNWAMKKYDFDIRSSKDYTYHGPVVKEFGGVKSTYWNAVARVDISHTGSSNAYIYLYGLSKNAYGLDIPGRFILLDGGASTRQFKVNGTVAEQTYLANALWASPYIARPDAQKVLTIGGGGGVDILVAKYFRAPEIDIAEINPSIYANLVGESDDPDRADYLPWYISDETTKVTVHLAEGRHFATTREAGSYDIVHGSAVDTLTATMAGGKALSENFMYTVEAVGDFARLLKPNGVLSLTHWRFETPTMSLRMFLTYLKYLEGDGTEEPWRNIVVIGGLGWTDSMMKKTPFTEAEVETIRSWADESGHVLLFDPFRTKLDQPGITKDEQLYTRLGYIESSRWPEILDFYQYDVMPSTDDRPYFYKVKKAKGLIGVFTNPTVFVIFLVGIAMSFVLVLLPLFGIRDDRRSRELSHYALFFAFCGFAFLLYETAIIQRFSVFVGGPLYSLSVVLVSVLAGYAIGSMCARFFKVARGTFLVLGILLFGMFIAMNAWLPEMIRALMPLSFPMRIATASGFTLIASAITALPVTLVMNNVRERHGSVVAWMWGVSSAFNVIGALTFVPLTQVYGVSAAILTVGVVYLIANVGFSFSDTIQSPGR